MRRTVGNNRSGNSAGIVSAGAVHSTPQTLSFEPLARSCSSSSLSLLSTPYPQCHPVVVVVVVVVLLDTRQMTISPGWNRREAVLFFFPSLSPPPPRPEAFFFILPIVDRRLRVCTRAFCDCFDAGRCYWWLLICLLSFFLYYSSIVDVAEVIIFFVLCIPRYDICSQGNIYECSCYRY